MFTVFIEKKYPKQIYFTTPDNFSKALLEVRLKQDEVLWENVSMEALILLKDRVHVFFYITMD